MRPLTLSTKMKPAHTTGHPCVPCFPASNSAYGINKRNRRESKDDAKPLHNSEKQSLQEGKNKNPRIFATFFRLATPFLTRKAKIRHRTPDYLRFCAFILTQGTRDGCQSQKSCAVERFSVFGVPNNLRRRHGHSGARAEPRERPIRVRRRGQGGPDQCSMDGTIGRSAADEAPWGAIWTQRRKAAAGRYEEQCGKAAPGTHPSLRDCGPKRKRRPHNADAFA